LLAADKGSFVRSGAGLTQLFFGQIKLGDDLEWAGGELLTGLKSFVEFPADMRPATGELEARMFATMGAVGGVTITLKGAVIVF
jgi:hypothetical protein